MEAPLRPPLPGHGSVASGRHYASAGLLSLLLGGFLALKLAYLTITIGDQGVYEYAAALWLKGIVPYRDFFLSHPPMHLLLPAAMISAGIRLPLLDITPSVIAAGSCALLFPVVRRSMGDIAALIASALFLFSYSNLTNSSHLTGVNTALFFVLLGTALSLRGNMATAGIALAVALLSGLYTLPAILAILVAAWMEKRSRFAALAGAFIAGAALLHGVFLLLAGEAFLRDVYLYHFAKTGDADFFAGKAETILLVARKDAVLLSLALLGIPLSLPALRARRHGGGGDAKALRLLRLSLIILLLYAAAFLLLRSIFSHYFLLTIPFAAIVGAFALERTRCWWPQRRRKWALLPIACVLLLFAGISVARYDDNREEKKLDGAGEIARYLSETLRGEETIYGDFAVVPTLALLSGRRIAANEVDSSIMRFTSGVSSLGEVIRSIEEDHIRLIVSRPHRGIVVYPPFRAYLEANYIPVRQFNAGTPKEIRVWRRRLPP